VRLAAGPTRAFGSVKGPLQASATNRLEELLEEAREIARNAARPDGRGGVTAFLEKPRPRFCRTASPA
jgi:enoyl-CoA hydratase/carnithine racemase